MSQAAQAPCGDVFVRCRSFEPQPHPHPTLNSGSQRSSHGGPLVEALGGPRITPALDLLRHQRCSSLPRPTPVSINPKTEHLVSPQRFAIHYLSNSKNSIMFPTLPNSMIASFVQLATARGRDPLVNVPKLEPSKIAQLRYNVGKVFAQHEVPTSFVDSDDLFSKQHPYVFPLLSQD